MTDMILKIESIGEGNRLETVWIPGIAQVRRRYDTDWQSEAVVLTFADGSPDETRPIRDGEGMYLCNDTGGTIEVLSRRNRTIAAPARDDTEMK